MKTTERQNDDPRNALDSSNSPSPADAADGQLIRGISLTGATTLNMIDMIGVGPFITIPTIIAAMNGPQAMVGWICGALLVICDGMVWAELGAAMPGSGGSYRYLKEIYGAEKLGRWISFLFIWQLTFSAPLSMATGCLGLARYASYIWPSLSKTFLVLGSDKIGITVTGMTFVAIGTVVLALLFLYRRITIISSLAKFLWIGVLLTVAWVIFAGVTNFQSARAFDFPPGAFTPSLAFFQGLGAAMLIAVYDYWGYYNVCFIGGEVKNPGYVIPRAVIYSILAVAAIYIVMNISILGVIPWQELAETGKSANAELQKHLVSNLMQRLYGNWAGTLASLLIMWTAFASVFSLLLGYSRVPYAAALDGNYFKSFARVHPVQRFPQVSLLVMGVVTALCCLFRLEDVLKAMVVIRISLQFLAQIAGLVVLRIRRPDMPRPFRMWLYPLPAIAAFCGFVYVLIVRSESIKQISLALVLAIIGSIIYFIRARRQGLWPFRSSNLAPSSGD